MKAVHNTEHTAFSRVAPVKNLRRCEASFYQNGELRPIIGRFHGWFSDFMEFENGPGNYTVALVEMDDGCVKSCAPNTVKFLDREDAYINNFNQLL